MYHWIKIKETFFYKWLNKTKKVVFSSKRIIFIYMLCADKYFHNYRKVKALQATNFIATHTSKTALAQETSDTVTTHKGPQFLGSTLASQVSRFSILWSWLRGSFTFVNTVYENFAITKALWSQSRSNVWKNIWLILGNREICSLWSMILNFFALDMAFSTTTLCRAIFFDLVTSLGVICFPEVAKGGIHRVSPRSCISLLMWKPLSTITPSPILSFPLSIKCFSCFRSPLCCVISLILTQKTAWRWKWMSLVDQLQPKLWVLLLLCSQSTSETDFSGNSAFPFLFLCHKYLCVG